MVDPLKLGETGTVLGSDVSFKGELTFENSMRIDGRFEGKLESKGKLAVGKSAHIAGEIIVGQLLIEGQFKGNATTAEKIELAATAQVMGDIRAPRLVVSEGATFVGNCHVSPDALKGTVTPSATTRSADPAFAKK